jgi:very-short-patch-repair endonuclease
LVVVGDDKQLPPTSFFSRIVSDEDDSDEDDEDSEGLKMAAVKDVESILNLCSRFPERMLRWHYRSEHPALIATSNRSFYKNQLMLPPSVLAGAGDGKTGLVFHLGRQGGYERGKTARNEFEAEEVAQAALRHAREHSNQSLGIGTFSMAQRDCVRDRLEHLAAQHPELDAFMKGRASGEPVFVKNLENIQGDERDVIFISVGYGRDKDGRLTQQFGPIGRDGGERRLNVLITRARKRCEVFSSIVAEDIKIDGAPKPGVQAFKEFLKLAKDGYSDVAYATRKGFDSDFEESVACVLTELGYEFHPQVGMAGFFVDIGVLDPRDPGRYLLGVECDGAAYHSSNYARDRDRLRQQILESRGWSIHRIWSTDWFYRQEREITKLRDALEKALAGAKLPDAQAVFTPESLIESSASAEPKETTEDSPGCFALPPYSMVEIRAQESSWAEPHELATSRLAELVTQIVQAEQPIHQEEVARRLAAAFGRQKAGSRIREAALRGLQNAARLNSLVEAQGFWRLANAADLPARSRSHLPAAATVRKPDLICPTEIAAAARVVLTGSLALEQQELVVETARALGFTRTGADVADAIKRAIKTELMADLEHDHMQRLRLIRR